MVCKIIIFTSFYGDMNPWLGTSGHHRSAVMSPVLLKKLKFSHFTVCPKDLDTPSCFALCVEVARICP